MKITSLEDLPEGGCVVKFESPSCIRCKQVQSQYEQFGNEVGLPVYSLDLVNHPMEDNFGVRSLPTFVLFQDGEVVSRFTPTHTDNNLLGLKGWLASVTTPAPQDDIVF